MYITRVNKNWGTARPQANLSKNLFFENQRICQKYMAMVGERTMVPIIRFIDISVNNGDKDEGKELTKEAFQILGQGMHINTSK